jgi:hypothetical protein
MGWFGKNKKSSPDTTGIAEQKWTAFLSDCDDVQNIVTEYGNVIEMASKMSYGAPQSLLPRPKAKLKQAIIKYAVCLHAQKDLDEKTLDMLKAAYSKLADFLDDADARIAIAAQSDFNYADVALQSARNPEDKTRIAKDVASRLSSPNYTAAVERQKRAGKEMESLSAEFDAVTTKLGIRFQK